MPDEADRFGSSQPNIAKSSGTGEAARREADPGTTELNKARKVWDAETPGDPSGRVADAGDAGGGNALPYDEEVEAEEVARQTEREAETDKD